MLIALWLTVLGLGALLLRYLPARCFPDFIRRQWFLFYFGMQTTFLAREGIILTQSQDWSQVLIAGHICAWIVCGITLYEVISFANVRRRAPKAVDQILDMVILPLNYVFFSVHSLRLLGETQPRDDVANALKIDIVTATVDAADVWESWALWSVLTIFASIVTSRTRIVKPTISPLREHSEPLLGVPQLTPRSLQNSREHRAMSGLQMLCMYVVQAWVLLNFLINLLELIVKGVIGAQLPTLCPYYLETCVSCSRWYDSEVAPYTQTLLYVFCSVAIYCVFKYEHIFHDELQTLAPYWKFFGVKSVVSVTSFQWLVIRYLMYPDDINKAYSSYNFCCCLELPILAIIHTWWAYPVTETSISEDGWLGFLCSAFEDIPQREASLPRSPLFRRSKYALLSTLTLMFFGAFLWWSLLKCNISDSTSMQLEWTPFQCHGLPPVVPFAETEQHSTDPMALCNARHFHCQLGYKGRPLVSCDANGGYSVYGSCAVIGCGTPAAIPHAEIVSNRTFWTLGQSVAYRCLRGYRGTISCVCQKNGTWSVSGSCEIVGCGADPPQIEHALPSQPRAATYTGEEIQFTCEQGYQGSPMATCASDSSWSVTGKCALFGTTYGCSCRASWKWCDMFGSNCEQEYGCGRTGEIFQWCRIVPGSCPSDAFFFGEPDWDYCVASETRNPADAPGILETLSWFVSCSAWISIVVLAFYILPQCRFRITRRASVQSIGCQNSTWDGEGTGLPGCADDKAAVVACETDGERSPVVTRSLHGGLDFAASGG